MVNFAQLNENNKIIKIIVVADKDCLDNLGNFSEEIGINFCKSLLGIETKWKIINKESIGSFYEENLNTFIPPEPHPSWIWNSQTSRWESPIGPAPSLTGEEIATGSIYRWNENNQNWKLLTLEVP